MALRPGDLEVGRVYHTSHQHVSPEELTVCAHLIGEGDDTDAPVLGIVFVWALRALIESEILPDGAIMLSHRVEWLRPPPTHGQVTTEVAISMIHEDGRRYRHVVIHYRSYDEWDEDIAIQYQGVLWPN